MTKRHLYRRTIKNQDGKSIRAWYYWYYDPQTHKQVRKSCGTGKVPVLIKREAEEIIAKLEAKERTYADLKAEAETVTVKVMADAMFTPGSVYLNLKKEQGEEKSEDTIKNIRQYLRLFILKNYGNLKLEQLEPVQIQNDLLAIDRSNSWRNRVISIIDTLFEEAVRNKMLKYKPVIPRFKTIVKRKKDILSTKDIDILFPEDSSLLSRLWDIDEKETDTGFMFGCFFGLMVSTGLRLGEARAINPVQLIVSQNNQIVPLMTHDHITTGNAVYGIIIDRMFDSHEQLVMHLKKGTEDDPRWRATLLPSRTVGYLRHWLMIRPRLVPDLLFPFRGKKINPRTAEKRLHVGFRNAGIPIDDRVITPHSLRFTYNTRMRRLIPGESLRLMIGHTTEGMTDYYTRLEVEEDFLSLITQNDNINRFWTGT